MSGRRPQWLRDVDGPEFVAVLADLTIAGIALYVLLDVVAQLLPPHYSPLRQAESDLAVGPYGYLMTVNFVLRGLLSLALLTALWRTPARGRRSLVGLAWLGVWGIASALLALFPTDLPGSGSVSVHGVLHLVLALVAFVAVATGELLVSLGLTTPPWPAGLRGFDLALAGLTILFLLVLLTGRPLHQFPGLHERLFLGSALLWMLVVAVELRHAARSAKRHAAIGLLR